MFNGLIERLGHWQCQGGAVATAAAVAAAVPVVVVPVELAAGVKSRGSMHQVQQKLVLRSVARVYRKQCQRR